jgi:pilus assembly protein CpaF
VNPVDPLLFTELTNAVQNALVEEATARMRAGRPMLERAAQEVLADKVLRAELQRIDADRLAAGASRLTADEERALCERVVAVSVGLGPIEWLLADETVEDIIATRFDLVWVYRRDGTVDLMEERLWASQTEMEAWLAHLARTAGRTERMFNSQVPLLVMRIGEWLRLAATRDVAKNVAFALRRNTLGKVNVTDLVGLDTFPQVVADLLTACMVSTEMRFVFAGPTGSGKTTCVRACLDVLEPRVRVVIIEDTAELDFFDPVLHPNVESWEARLPNNEGEGEITQGQLVKHSNRVRPDWLVYGEVRDADGAVPMLKSMTHGQSALTTVHSATAVGALDKLALYLGTGEDRLPPHVAHQQLSQAIDFVVHLDRLPNGRRVMTELIEVAGFDGSRCTTNTIAVLDRASGEFSTLNRLTDHHRQALQRAGFDASALGGGLR